MKKKLLVKWTAFNKRRIENAPARLKHSASKPKSWIFVLFFFFSFTFLFYFWFREVICQSKNCVFLVRFVVFIKIDENMLVTYRLPTNKKLFGFFLYLLLHEYWEDLKILLMLTDEVKRKEKKNCNSNLVSVIEIVWVFFSPQSPDDNSLNISISIETNNK